MKTLEIRENTLQISRYTNKMKYISSFLSYFLRLYYIILYIRLHGYNNIVIAIIWYQFQYSSAISNLDTSHFVRYTLLFVVILFLSVKIALIFIKLK